jgi:hypothetical protein
VRLFLIKIFVIVAENILAKIDSKEIDPSN